MPFRLSAALLLGLAVAAPALAETPPPVAAGVPPITIGPRPVMNPKEVEARKTELLARQLDELRRGINPKGPQVALWTTFEGQAKASIPASFKLVDAFCVDPTPQEGRASFGETAKRLDAVMAMMRIRAADMTQLDASLSALWASLDPDQQKAFKAASAPVVTTVTGVPFGLPDTGLPFSCDAITGRVRPGPGGLLAPTR